MAILLFIYFFFFFTFTDNTGILEILSAGSLHFASHCVLFILDHPCFIKRDDFG